MPSDEFTVSFWITTATNPLWADEESNLRFPQFSDQSPYLIFEKEGKILNVFRNVDSNKLLINQVNIQRFIGKNTMIMLTLKNEESKIYLNGQIAS